MNLSTSVSIAALFLAPLSGIAQAGTHFDYSSLPLAFEPLPDVSQYVARGAGFSVTVRPDGAVVRFGKGGEKASTVRLRFAGLRFRRGLSR